MSKKSLFCFFSLVAFLLGSMLVLHWRTSQEVRQWKVELEYIYRRQKLVNSMALSIEQYRRASMNFKQLEPTEIHAWKDKIHSSFLGEIQNLEALNPGASEQSIHHRLGEELETLLSTIKRVEPLLSSKDAYQKVEVQGLHDQVVASLVELESIMEERLETLPADFEYFESRSFFVLSALIGLVLVLLVFFIIRNHSAYVVPLRRLHKYAAKLRTAAGSSDTRSTVPELYGAYAGISAVLQELTKELQVYVRDRHKFILDLLSDLSGPLSLLKEGKLLLSQVYQSPVETSEGLDPSVDRSEQVQLINSVRKGLSILSGSLDDLADFVEINRLDARLQAQTVDLSKLLIEVLSIFFPPSFLKDPQRLRIPPMPVWVEIDPRRFERMLIQVLSKLVHVSVPRALFTAHLSADPQLNPWGVELTIYSEAQSQVFNQIFPKNKNSNINTLLHTTRSRRLPSGPEQELRSHWISEKGLLIQLAQKIVRAHGGSIHAAGVAGSSIRVIIRLPSHRVINHGLVTNPDIGQLVRSVQKKSVLKEKNI